MCATACPCIVLYANKDHQQAHAALISVMQDVAMDATGCACGVCTCAQEISY
jgi:hypothetical protein